MKAAPYRILRVFSTLNDSLGTRCLKVKDKKAFSSTYQRLAQIDLRSRYSPRPAETNSCKAFFTKPVVSHHLYLSFYLLLLAQ